MRRARHRGEIEKEAALRSVAFFLFPTNLANARRSGLTQLSKTAIEIAENMPSELYWIDTSNELKLAIMARPRAGDWLEDEIAHWRHSGVGIVVSLLEREEIEDLGLELEAAICRQNGIDYVSFPISDRGVPDDSGAVMQLAAHLATKGVPIAIHCRAGIGRSALMASAVLIGIGFEPDAALSAVQMARRSPVPDTDAQRDWVLKLRN